MFCLYIYIQDKKYFGMGTSYGKFQDDTYFLCKKGNGLFVSLEKLFPCHPQGISVTQPSSHHSMPPVEGIGQQSHTQPRSNSQRHQDNVIAVTNVSAAPATLEVGSSVELLGNPGRHGVIRWMGTLPGVRGTIAGVELVGSVVLCFMYNTFFSRLRMVQWRGVGMGSGVVIATLPVSPGEPSSVLSPLSYLTQVKSRTLLNIENSRITTVRGYRSYFSCP